MARSTGVGSMWLTAAVLIFVSFCGAEGAACGTYKGYVEGWPSSTYLGEYKAKEVKSLDDLPDAIRAKLIAHMLNRLGPEYFSRLNVEAGQIVDFDELHRVNPRAKNYRWQVFAY